MLLQVDTLLLGTDSRAIGGCLWEIVDAAYHIVKTHRDDLGSGHAVMSGVGWGNQEDHGGSRCGRILHRRCACLNCRFEHVEGRSKSLVFLAS